MRIDSKLTRLTITAAVLAARIAVPLAAQEGPFSAFPSEALDDGRFLAAVSGLSGLSDEETAIGLLVPADESTFTFRIFDGDTGDPCTEGPPTCVDPVLGHWDEGTTPLQVEMYRDPLQQGNTSPADLVGVWFGNQDNPTVDPDGLWTASPARMPDNDFWSVTVTVDDAARSPSGDAFYHVVIKLGLPDDGATVSNFKVQADVFLLISSLNFGFEAGLGGLFNDLAVLYPGWTVDEFLADPLTFVKRVAEEGGTTYDGDYRFFFELREEQERLTLWDGDFDHGTSVNPARQMGDPSGQSFDLCTDDDDPNTEATPPPFAGPSAVDEGVQTQGDPEDDHPADFLRRSPCVYYEVIDPNGNVYVNDNPSSDQEWERFVISSDPADGPDVADYSPTTARDGKTFVGTDMLPAGLWEVRVVGLDVSNSNFWRFEQRVCGLIDGAAECPPEPVKIGDTVFLDLDGDGAQDGGEPGVNGCKVNLVGNGMAVTSTMGGADGRYMFNVSPGTAADPAEYTVEVAAECRGEVASGALGDRVFFDLDGDGLEDLGEPGIPNVEVQLLACPGGVPGASLGTTLTDPDGRYWFDLLLPGEYCTAVVDSTLPAGLALSSGTNPSASRTIVSDEEFDDLDFGYDLADASKAALGDEVWVDLDGDGVRDAGEPGLDNVVLELRACGSATLLATTRTDGAGFYSFGELDAPACYKVTVRASTLPGGLAAVYDLDDGLTMPDGMAEAQVVPGEFRLDVDFGYDDDPNDNLTPLYCVADRKWFDADANGLFDGADFPLPGVTVVLRNGEREAVASAVSGADGRFEFCGLTGDDPATTSFREAETYFLDLTDRGNVLAGLVGTTQPAIDRELEVLVVDADVRGESFGCFRQGLLEFCDFTTPTSITGAIEWVLIDPDRPPVPRNNLDFDFGCRPFYMIGDRVWLDVDGDGVGGDFGNDDGEPGIANVTVKLIDKATGQQIATAQTDGTGFYKFDRVVSGNYTVMVDPATLPPNLVQTFDLDGVLDDMTMFELAGDLPPGAFKRDVDFGYVASDSCATGRPSVLVFEYTGDSCSSLAASQNDQGGRPGTRGDYSCRGPLDGDEPVRLVITKKSERVRVEPSGETIAVGDRVTLSSADRRRLFPATRVALRQGGRTLQEIAIHTSCSQPLEVGDQFGSLTLRLFRN